MARKSEKGARQARIQCEKWRQFFHINNDQYHRMFDFILGKQWNDDEEDMLKTFRKVPLQFNKLATLINSLLGEQQQNTPQLEIYPLSDCDEQTASIRQMIIKDIMLSQDAKTVYQVAAMQAFVGGFGAFVWDTQYTHNKSFDLDIVPRYFKDATRCYWDVGAEHVNKIDGMYCGFIARMTRSKFREVYGRDMEGKINKESSITATESEIALAVQPDLEDDPFSWADDESITINHNFVRKYKNSMLYKMSNGEILDEEDMEKMVENSLDIARQMEMMQDLGEFSGMEPMQENAPMPMEGLPQMPPMQMNSMRSGQQDIEIEEVTLSPEMVTLYSNGEVVRIEEKREVRISTILYRKFAGDLVLEKVEFPSEDLPLIFVDQNSYWQKDGKQMCRPFAIDAIDAQRYLNYLGTQSAYILKVSRYDQFMASKKNIQGADTQQKWADPYAIQGAITYDESPSGAKPEQIRPPELSASLGQQYQRAIEDMYTSTGLYPTRMGQQGNEISGAAIDARTRQGSYATYVAFNSINRAISTGGQIVNQMVPRVYDSQRVINLMTPDEGRKNITVNKQVDDYGMKIENDLRKGTFEVRLQAGPSYEGQKAQALESLNMVLQANPQLLNLFADLYAENLPLVNTIEIKNRLKTIVPPAIIEAGKTGKMPQENGQQQPDPQQIQLQMQQQQMQMQQQQAQMDMQFKQAEIELKKQELQLKAQQQQIDLEIERQKLQGEELEIAGKLEEQKLRYMAETQRTHSDNAISHADNLTKILTHNIKQ